jgi:antitoxin MazE
MLTVRKSYIMAVTRIGPKHQVTIPQEAFRRLGLKPGDFLEVEVRGEALYLVPQRLIPRDQAWFWTREWQEKEREADEAIAKGELSGPFESVEDLIRYLRGT